SPNEATTFAPLVFDKATSWSSSISMVGTSAPFTLVAPSVCTLMTLLSRTATTTCILGQKHERVNSNWYADGPCACHNARALIAFFGAPANVVVVDGGGGSFRVGFELEPHAAASTTTGIRYAWRRCRRPRTRNRARASFDSSRRRSIACPPLR